MNHLERIEEQFTTVTEARSEMKGRLELLREQKRSASEELSTLTGDYKVQESVLDILRQYAILKEQILRERLDKIVTQGLKLIFGDQYKSKLEFGISRGQAVIKPKIITQINGKEFEADVATAHGGGLTNVIAVIYQILVLALVRPRQRQIMMLDEPFRNVSEEYLEGAGQFLRHLNEKLGIQIVLISHRKSLADVADVQYEFSLENGETKVKKIE